MSQPLVSILIPAYNAERFIAETLDSAFAQDYEEIEVIVVDDGSTDGTAAIASRWPVRLIGQANLGPSAARNAALAEAGGEFITVLDADDLWPVDRLTLQVNCLLERPESSVVMGLTEAFINPGDPTPAHWPEDWGAGPIPHVPGTLLARRAVFDEVGGWDESLPTCEDFDWLVRAKDAGHVPVALEVVLLSYRIHANNISRHHGSNLAMLLRVMRASVQRQRTIGR